MIRSLPRRWRAIGATVLMLTVPASARPPEIAPYRWTNVKVGAGGYAPNIVFSPAERGLAYLRTDMGGAYRWTTGNSAGCRCRTATPSRATWASKA